MRAIGALGSILILATGCATYRAEYEIPLKVVEVNDGRKPTEEIKRLSDKGNAIYIFEDPDVRLFWSPSVDRFRFKLGNKTDHTLRILWDEAAYVDPRGESHRIVHSGIKHEDANKPQPPSTVVKRQIFSDSILPADHIELEPGPYGVWREKPFFPGTARKKGSLKAEAQKVVGKRVKVLLPLEIEGKKREYIFIFEIKGFQIH
ncbi:MAG: hypothetical protein ACYTHM_08525 [Planctomycetota bacterium]|jgi:hypothetical protein